ncbi:hypothetical protein BKA65DRAFT_237188 [Rhexocercosporidium sp. MPI-PUGE-AT-0058]|nr:hypothetical protein BKA65DRAFT_237188 [Rhexocercosporidium sp. MPI-PUGE-AT-0058]
MRFYVEPPLASSLHPFFSQWNICVRGIQVSCLLQPRHPPISWDIRSIPPSVIIIYRKAFLYSIITKSTFSNMTCASTSCHNRCLRGYSYCRHHKCQASSCEKLSQSGKSWCENHICTYSACGSQNLGYTPGCRRHKCRLSNCSNIRHLNSNHCEYHMCSRTGCPRPQQGDAAVCEAHLCQMQGCSLESEDYPGSRACAYHVCYFEGCKRVQMPHGQDFCRRHCCHWTHTPCSEGVIEGSKFCTHHKCPGCTNCCRTAGQYCDSCRCSYPNCRYPNSGDGECCSDHTCNTEGCPQSLTDESGYLFCKSHTCRWTVDSYKCGSEIVRGAPCCDAHTCCEENCFKARFDRGRYCEDHTCSHDRCFNWRDSASGTTCQNHNVQALIPLATSKAPRRRQSTQQNINTAYGRAYIEGVSHGLNVAPDAQEEARRLFGNMNIYRPADQDPSRRQMEAAVNEAIKRRGRKGTKKIQDVEEKKKDGEGEGDGDEGGL